MHSDLEHSLSATLREFLKKARVSMERLQEEAVGHERKAAKARGMLMKEVEKERAAMLAERKMIEESNTLQEQIVKLDVGGHCYTTSTSTLTSQPGMLQAMFSGRYDVKKTSEGRVFIDRDGTLFRYVLSYLRNGTLDLLGISARKLRQIRQEFEFYNLPLTHPCPSLVCVGGMSAHARGMSDRVDALDFVTGEWESMVALPGPRTSHCVCVVDNVVYCIGGVAGEEALSSVFCLRPGGTHWETVGQGLLQPVCEAECAVVGDFVYLLGGSPEGNELGPVAAVRRMSLETKEWDTVAPMREARISFGCCKLGTDIYVLGGEGVDGSTLASAERYSTTSGTWEAMPALPSAREGTAACVLDGFVYVIGGLDERGDVVGKVERFDPATRAWETHSELNEARNAAGVCEYEGSIYVAGGLTDDGCHISNMEKLCSTTGRWLVIPGGMTVARCSVGLCSVVTWKDFFEGQLNRLEGASSASPPQGEEDGPSSKRRRSPREDQ